MLRDHIHSLLNQTPETISNSLSDDILVKQDGSLGYIGNVSQSKLKRACRHLDKPGSHAPAFFDWLITGLLEHRIRINEPKAPVHIVENYFGIVSPRAFQLYANAVEYPCISTKLVSRDVQSLKLHVRANKGSSFYPVRVGNGPHKTTLHCLLIHRTLIPRIEKFRPNILMSLLPEQFNERTASNRACVRRSPPPLFSIDGRSMSIVSSR